MTELLKAGRLSVLMLPFRVGADLRRVVTRLLIRRILREREQASQIRQRLDIEIWTKKLGRAWKKSLPAVCRARS